ncbi:MAG: gamma-glutamyltransferase [Planctomycetota bacterium]
MFDLPARDRRSLLHSAFRCGIATAGAASLARPLSAHQVGDTTEPSNRSSASNFARSSRGVAASVHPLASQAAIDAMRSGGNAVDAAVAASLMLSVVDGHNSGLGGGCFIMLRTPSGKCIAIDGRETAPGLATPDRFTRDGQPDPMSTRVGPKAVGTPGQVAALDSLLKNHGRRSFAQAIAPAQRVAEEGFVLEAYGCKRMASVAGLLKADPGSRSVYFDSRGQILRPGDTLKQPDLAATLKQLATRGADWFYEGDFAKQVDAWMRANDGLLRQEDFRNYRVLNRQPILARYRDHSIYLFPPPSSGGVHIAQALSILQSYDLTQLHDKTPDAFYHLLLETMRLVMADRVRHLGDADFVDVPRGLLDEDYLRGRASNLSLKQVMEAVEPGQPKDTTPWPKSPAKMPDAAEKHTTHLTTADADGNVVAITQTINTTYGSKVIVPGTGVVLNNEMDDFSIGAGIANAYGLMGGQANRIQPGKRPLSSMSPSIAIQDETGEIFSCGAAGGPRILTTVLQLLIRHIDLKQSPEMLLAAPRVHHQWRPATSFMEAGLSEETQQTLKELGHPLKTLTYNSTAQALRCDAQQLQAASDPRVPGAARGL